MEHTVKERIRSFLKEFNIKGKDFCSTIGVSSGFISGMRESIQPDKLKSIATNYPMLDIGWLMTGEGSMLKTYSQLPKNSGTINNHIEGNVSHPIISHIGDGNSSNIEISDERNTKDVSKRQAMDMIRLKEEIIRLKDQIDSKDKLLDEKDKVIAEKERFIQLILNKL